jgi:hypothetical protein
MSSRSIFVPGGRAESPHKLRIPLSSGADGCVGYVGTSSRLRWEEPGSGVRTTVTPNCYYYK